MKLSRIYRLILSLIAFLLIQNNLYAQSHISNQAHDDNVTQIVPLETTTYSDDTFISAGRDGYLIKWTSDNLGEHYQITDLQIKLIARSPKNNEIAVYETDGVSIHRLSVWNWTTFTRKYSKVFNDSITALSYSEKGTYLMLGTSSMNGVYILNASSGSVAKKPANAPSLVTLLKTGDSEKNLLMYSATGSLVYYDLTKNKQTAKFLIESRLEQPLLFGSGDTKNRFIAGYKENSVTICDALSGKTIASYPAKQSLLFSSRSPYEDSIYFTSFDGKEYSLRAVDFETLKSQVLNPDRAFNPPAPQIVKNFTGPRGKDYFTSASKNVNTILLGSLSGNVYSMNAIPESEKLSLGPVTEKTFDPMKDICTDGEYFYLLTSNAVFKSTYGEEIPVLAGTNPQHTNIIKYKNGAILWSKETRKNVCFLPLEETNSAADILFTPENTIQTLRLYKDKLIYIEGNSAVKIYDFETKQTNLLYSGTAIQDAIIYNDSYVYVAKTAAVEPATALLQINIQTGETLPLKFQGTIAYSLTFDDSKENSPIYGIRIIADDNNKTSTQLFSYSTKNSNTVKLLSIAAEDSDAVTNLCPPMLFTNFGKQIIRSYNVSTKKTTQYKRSASIPHKAASNKTMTAVLNKDGSISWYKNGSSTLICDWFLTTDGEWVEY